jgi:HEAT repeat protein
MSPVTVFFRTLLKCSAIFLGCGLALVNPTMDWSGGARMTGVTAQKSPIESAVDGLIAALKDTDDGVRRQAAFALGEMDHARAVPALIEAIDDKNAGVRRAVIRALADIGDVRALPALTAALKDSDAGVRREAVMAIAELEGEDPRSRARSGGR